MSAARSLKRQERQAALRADERYCGGKAACFPQRLKAAKKEARLRREAPFKRQHCAYGAGLAAHLGAFASLRETKGASATQTLKEKQSSLALLAFQSICLTTANASESTQ